jgi:hypothetical protein
VLGANSTKLIPQVLPPALDAEMTVLGATREHKPDFVKKIYFLKGI